MQYGNSILIVFINTRSFMYHVFLANFRTNLANFLTQLQSSPTKHIIYLMVYGMVFLLLVLLLATKNSLNTKFKSNKQVQSTMITRVY